MLTYRGKNFELSAPVEIYINRYVFFLLCLVVPAKSSEAPIIFSIIMTDTIITIIIPSTYSHNHYDVRSL